MRDPGEQCELVTGAEEGDGRVLRPARREVDQPAADHRERARTRVDDRRDELRQADRERPPQLSPAAADRAAGPRAVVPRSRVRHVMSVRR